MERSLAGKAVIITGAGSGIGLAATTEFLNAGAYVIGGDINLEKLYELQGGEYLFPYQFNVRDPSDIDGLINTAISQFGKIDILINNAALVEPRKSFLDVTDDDWNSTIETNLLGYIRMARGVLPYMCNQKKGILLHIASEAALMPNLILPDYSILKSSVLTLSKVISREFGKYGIRSNVISPAFIHTSIYDKPEGLITQLEQKYKVGREEALQRYIEEVDIAVGRLGQPEEVAVLLLFLASESAGFITGANYLVDGGVTPFI
ncbi:SDR family oxidoreductase [Xenorhabdus bovienii]|uniref:Putative 3-oxoacyl-(Acyl-carrier-protein) reductase n=1 Tax=Xenorhabdus bovienii str. Intermedium TaxID=1379677 RepID=A0A077Q6B5_XENBV|nr:SDR family oxidoreductase [Xenorhabdus bovienii]MDE9554020.1 SDR family oxidoreductase [Xenorhabdus bovienii]CDH31612.1 putative 3-oxoacyl-(acyl-carrier-protein) reductase [Xenorhabdus bovienii str. Intermedium]